MFRDTSNSKIDRSLFGVGSVMTMGDERFLVVAETGFKNVRLIDLNTFQIVEGFVNCADTSFLSKEEARSLGYLLECTLSDFDFDTKGLK